MSIDLRAVIGSALAATDRSTQPGMPPRQRNAARSRQWVNLLAAGFETCYPQPGYTVFRRDCAWHRHDYGLNELLCDILVCRSEAPLRGRRYLQSAEWAIESEFSRYARDALLDFSKLNLVKARNKLLVISAGANGIHALLQQCAKADGGENFFIAELPHPDTWRLEQLPVFRLWQIGESPGDWRECRVTASPPPA